MRNRRGSGLPLPRFLQFAAHPALGAAGVGSGERRQAVTAKVVRAASAAAAKNTSAPDKFPIDFYRKLLYDMEAVNGLSGGTTHLGI